MLLDAGMRPVLPKPGRETIKLVAAAFVLIAVVSIFVVLTFHDYIRQAKAERDKVHIGMTVDQVLPLVHGAFLIMARAVVPDKVSDEEAGHSASLAEHEDGTFGCSLASDQSLTGADAAALMKQKMSDGYEWRWRYLFMNNTPVHYKFTVTFGRDGRVKDVTAVEGFD